MKTLATSPADMKEIVRRSPRMFYWRQRQDSVRVHLVQLLQRKTPSLMTSRAADCGHANGCQQLFNTRSRINHRVDPVKMMELSFPHN